MLDNSSLNENNEVFVGKRKDNPIDKWQMPQGGIDKMRVWKMQ